MGAASANAWAKGATQQGPRETEKVRSAWRVVLEVLFLSVCLRVGCRTRRMLGRFAEAVFCGPGHGAARGPVCAWGVLFGKVGKTGVRSLDITILPVV